MAITVVQHTKNTSIALANTVTVTVSANSAGNLLVCGIANQGTTTVASVTDNATGGSNTWVQGASAAATANTIDGVDIWYVLSAAHAGATTITITYSAAAGTFFKGVEFWEVSGLTNAAVDQIAVVNNTLQTTQDDTGASVTTTSSTGFIVGIVDSGTTGTIASNPKAGNEFTSGGDIVNSTTPGVGAVSFISSTAAAHQPVWRDSNSFINYCASTVAFKSGNLPGHIQLEGGTGNVKLENSTGDIALEY